MSRPWHVIRDRMRARDPDWDAKVDAIKRQMDRDLIAADEDLAAGRTRSAADVLRVDDES